MNNILGLLTNALAAHGKQRTALSLGDRSQYIGMSDIAKATDCLRAAVANKLRLATSTPVSLSRELRLQRGHWFEQGVADAFTATGRPFLHQLEIRIQHHGIPVQAHLDFVFIEQGEEKPAHVQVIECKSCENIPETAYASYEMQVYGQIGILRAYWNQPCFSVAGTASSQKLMTFPALIEKVSSLLLPHNVNDVVITGSILCLSMNDAKDFGPYHPNDLMLTACLGLGESIRQGMVAVHTGKASLNDLPTAKGHHPLCNYCEENADCPRFDGIDAHDIESDLQHLVRLKAEKELLSKNIQEEETKLKHLCRARLPQGGWLHAEANRVRLTCCEGKRSLDKELLYSELSHRLGEDTALALIESAHRTGNGYERLTISNIN